MQQSVDFDLHGILGVRLIDPAENDITTQSMQLGAPVAALERAPDIVIRYQETLPAQSITYLGLNAAGFNEDGFYLLDRKNGRAKARIPFQQIGGQCEIECPTGVGSIPLLLDILVVTLLAKNHVPLHASAFEYEGKGILVVGWTKGGKTEALLSFAARGAKYVGDEWVVLSGDGRTMFGIPVPVTVWRWQLEDVPGLLPKPSLGKRAIFTAVDLMDSLHQASERSRLHGAFPFELLDQALPALRRQLKVVEWPPTIFGDAICRKPVKIDKVFLAMSHEDASVRVEPCDSDEVAHRMASSNECEQMYLFEHYKAFQFAFPHLRNPFLETVDQRQRSLLCRALAGKEAYKVLHPYPVSLAALFEQMQPFC